MDGHLKFRESPLWIAIVVSWMIAFLEYCFQVPANRIGSYPFSDCTAEDDSGGHHAGCVFGVFDDLFARAVSMELRRRLWVDRGRGVFHVL